ncbi:hypothetical protein [Virgibacillus profundi]|uniref:hypothetical protein n=1 Tax=Virgibacillus profundi TaxID=2024555 RepID=UPI0013FE19AA|nr:hypothetical protein [Virgibacillus profundi]
MGGNLFAGGIAESIDPKISLAFCAFLLLIAAVISLSFKLGNKQLDKLIPIEFKENRK